MAVKPGFNIAQIHYVRRELNFNGRLYLVGQPFPWRRIGCAVRRLRQLYEMGKLEYIIDEDVDIPDVEDQSIDGSGDSNELDDDNNESDEENELDDDSDKKELPKPRKRRNRKKS